jgi:hypothetical protein
LRRQASPARVIDAHTHWFPPEWVEFVKAQGPAHGARIAIDERGNAAKLFKA